MCSFSHQAAANLEESLLTRRVEREVVEAPAREDRLPRRRVDPIHLERMENRVGTDLDEDVTSPWRIFLGSVEGHARVKDALVEGDQPVHVAGQEGHVVQAVEQRHRLFLARFAGDTDLTSRA